MINKLFEKNEKIICISLIVIYVVTNSYCVQNYGIADYRSGLINTVFSLVLIILMKYSNGLPYYGIQKVSNTKKYLYFFPLVIIATVNLWRGMDLSKSLKEVGLYFWTMINVGFIEEIIFRGFLFRMIAHESQQKAIIITAVTFGIGHIVNLFNGADFVSTFAQIIYAISIGYLFSVIFCKSSSLLPCILTHIAINSLAVFAVRGNDVYICICSTLLTIISLSYAYYINKLK
ncbi:MAG: CPBP family intramembrane metalloprotease [Erysipelotrichia bacterium]|nr:CPBP family intramembrane metalloprotease [Erysipelotrichia bacterium]